jgi:hypothetical protein
MVCAQPVRQCANGSALGQHYCDTCGCLRSLHKMQEVECLLWSCFMCLHGKSWATCFAHLLRVALSCRKLTTATEGLDAGHSVTGCEVDVT